jgi:hypothetical protein
MVTSISLLQSATSTSTTTTKSATQSDTQSKGISLSQDVLSLGTSGTVTSDQAMNLVVERAMDKLRSVVDQARADLGMDKDTQVDTSPDATADRIVTFALGAFDKYAKQHGLENNEDGRSQFATFIGGAIKEGVSQARGILTALSALTPDVNTNITKTTDVIQQRLDDFVKNGLTTNQ